MFSDFIHRKEKLSVLLVLGLALSQSGCMAKRGFSPPPGATTQNWHVVSAMGNTANLSHTGTTVFNNARNTLDATVWDVDRRVEAQAMKQRPSLKWQKIEWNPEERKLIAEIKPESHTGIFSAGARKEAVSLLAGRCNCDLAIIVAPLRTEDYIYGTNQQIDGYGVFQRGLLGRPDMAFAYANYSVLLLDVKRGEELGTAFNRLHTSLPFSLDKERDLVPSAGEAAAIEEIVMRFMLGGDLLEGTAIPGTN